MRIAWRIHALLLVLSGLLTGCGAAGDRDAVTKRVEATNSAEAVPVKQVVIDSFTYDPPTLAIAAGTRVTWINRDDVPHTVTSTAKPRTIDSGALDTDQRFSHVFKTKGTYEYFCAVHPKMTAKIVVE